MHEGCVSCIDSCVAFSGVTGAVVQAKHCALLESLFLLLDSTCWPLKVVIMWQF